MSVAEKIKSWASTSDRLAVDGVACIYLDMDGLITDFIGGFLKEFPDIDRNDQLWRFYDGSITDSEFNERLRQLPESFWCRLEGTVYADVLMELVNEYENVFILTHAPSTEAFKGKYGWAVLNGLKDVTKILCVSESDYKSVFGPGGILIDDFAYNLDCFEAKGGLGFLAKTSYNPEGTSVFDFIDGLKEAGILVPATGDLSGLAKAITFATGEESEYVSDSGGRKNSKPVRIDLIAPAGMECLGRIYHFGGQKYDDHNYRKGVPWSLFLAAMQRHLWAFIDGEDDDPQSGLNHLGHVAWHCFAILQSIADHGRKYDDRYTKKASDQERSEGVVGDGPEQP